VAGRIEPPRPGPAPAASATPPGLSATPDLGALLQGLRRRWIAFVLLGGLLGTLAGGTAWAALTPKHVAFAQIRVGYHEEKFFGPAQGAGQGDFKTRLQTTANEVMSRPVIKAALKRDEVRRLNLEAIDPYPETWVAERITVDFKESSELLTIMVSTDDPVTSATLANAIKESFMEVIVEKRKDEATRKVTELENAKDQASAKLQKLKAAYEKETKDTPDAATWQVRRQEAGMALRDARQQQLQSGFKLAEAVANLEAFDLRTKTGADGKPPALSVKALVAKAMNADADVKRLRDRIEQLENVLERYAGNPGLPTAYRARERIASLQRQVEKRRQAIEEDIKEAGAPGVPGAMSAAETAFVRTQLKKTADAWATQDKGLKEEIDRLTKEVTRTPIRIAEAERLLEDIHSLEKVADELNRKFTQEQVELKAAQRITPYQDAEPMKKDIKKQVLATAVSPLAVLFAVGTGLAWFDYRQRRVRTAGQLSRGLGIRVVGAVPEVPNLERQLVGPSGELVLEGHPVLESIDALRTFLLHEADVHATRVVMVTSAAGGEGKTTLASHLATSLARAGRKALLIDADLRRPSVHELFELPTQPGFSEVLLGEVEATEACQETSLDGLFVIPAGQWDREVLQALARDGLVGVFEKLQQEFDFIVIDSHPVLPATDSLLLGRQVDAVILSVRREVSQMPKVYAAAQRLGALGVRVLGAVVHGTDPEEVFTNPATPEAATV
jgi:capsular exopolysaccharide synthesis family protein